MVLEKALDAVSADIFWDSQTQLYPWVVLAISSGTQTVLYMRVYRPLHNEAFRLGKIAVHLPELIPSVIFQPPLVNLRTVRSRCPWPFGCCDRKMRP